MFPKYHPCSADIDMSVYAYGRCIRMCNSPKYDADGKLSNRIYPASAEIFPKTVLRWTDDCTILKQTLTTMVKNYFNIGQAACVENV